MMRHISWARRTKGEFAAAVGALLALCEPWVVPAWFALLDLTRPVRRALGMQNETGFCGTAA